MSQRHVILVMYDGPDTAEFLEWMNGPHYDEVKATPGIVAARRFEVTSGPAGHRRYVAILETDDLERTLAWRDSPDGQRSQKEANDRGVSNRYALVCKLAYSTVPEKFP
jgi:hypothetical protein